MAKLGVGLDIGTNYIKVVEIQGGNNLRLCHSGFISIPVGAVSAGEIADRNTITAAIKELFSKSRISSNRVVIAISGQAVVMRNIKMPFMSDQEIEGAIYWEAERYIPFPIDEVTLDFKIIDRNEAQNEVEVMLVCARNDIIYEHIETIKDAGLQPTAIDIQLLGLSRAVGLESEKNSGIVGVLDIGAGSTDLMILRDGIPLFTRMIPIGGNRFTQTISENMGLTFEQAENFKNEHIDALHHIDMTINQNPNTNVEFAIQEGIKELILEVRRSLDYFQLQQRNEEIKQIIVSGGGSKLKNLNSLLSQELGISVSDSFVPRCLRVSKRDLPQFEDQLPILNVALGLAMREVVSE